MKALFFLIVATASVLAVSPNYGSYVCVCNANSAEVTFVNYALQDCAGNATIYQKPLFQCLTETYMGKTYSWNGLCNSTNMWYQNFEGGECQGSSLQTRTYQTLQCLNCPNPECKNPN